MRCLQRLQNSRIVTQSVLSELESSLGKRNPVTCLLKSKAYRSQCILEESNYDLYNVNEDLEGEGLENNSPGLDTDLQQSFQFNPASRGAVPSNYPNPNSMSQARLQGANDNLQ